MSSVMHTENDVGGEPEIFECTFTRGCREQRIMKEVQDKDWYMCNADFQCGGQRIRTVSQ